MLECCIKRNRILAALGDLLRAVLVGDEDVKEFAAQSGSERRNFEGSAYDNNRLFVVHHPPVKGDALILFRSMARRQKEPG